MSSAQRTVPLLNELRCRRLVESAIDVFDLDLADLVVLTEAASGYYALTPLIATLAGAHQVLCLAGDSRFGTARDVSRDLNALAARWGVGDVIDVLSSRADERVGEADVVTNLGFVRPLDKPFLGRLKRTAVIPLMWETWEFRAEDVDLEECRRLGIAVLGTNEHHPLLQTMDHVGVIALKLLLSMDVEIVGSQVAVLGDGEFGDQVERRLRMAGAGIVRLSRGNGSGLAAGPALRDLADSDALVVVEHSYRGLLVGPGGPLEPAQLQSANPGLAVAHICGQVDRQSLVDVGLQCAPEAFSPAGHMSLATDFVGPRPLIDLHTAGLKVGESLARARLGGSDARESEAEVLAGTGIAQGFA